MLSKIVVVGSSNTDMVIKSSRLPAPGETVLGGDLLMNPGGKGANQAVAAAKLGGDVAFVAKIGADIFGEAAIANFNQQGLDTSHVLKDPSTPSGVALIMVDDAGENCISVALGANNTLSTTDLDSAEQLISVADIMLIQLETPTETVYHAIRLAERLNTQVILNPAPAQHLDPNILPYIDTITPNESEAELLTGIKIIDIDSARTAAQQLRTKGIRQVIITLGEKGAFVSSAEVEEIVDTYPVKPIDATAAGDTFNAALAVAFAEQKDIRSAVRFANRAASLSVTRLGAQQAIPTRAEVEALLISNS